MQMSERATSCRKCGRPVIHVRDPFTLATFPVDAEPSVGVTLDPPAEGERNARVSGRAEVYAPHLQTCEPTDQEGEEEDGGEE